MPTSTPDDQNSTVVTRVVSALGSATAALISGASQISIGDLLALSPHPTPFGSPEIPNSDATATVLTEDSSFLAGGLNRDATATYRNLDPALSASQHSGTVSQAQAEATDTSAPTSHYMIQFSRAGQEFTRNDRSSPYLLYVNETDHTNRGVNAAIQGDGYPTKNKSDRTMLDYAQRLHGSVTGYDKVKGLRSFKDFGKLVKAETASTRATLSDGMSMSANPVKSIDNEFLVQIRVSGETSKPTLTPKTPKGKKLGRRKREQLEEQQALSRSSLQS